MEDFLNQREQRIQEEKLEVVRELREKGTQKGGLAMDQKTQSSRYIPAKVRNLLKQEYGEKCAHEYCVNKSTNTHHTRRFGLHPSHNPLFLAPLCQQHHEIAHSLDVRVQEHRRR
ncbi:MAG: hypothetical protein AAB558_00300 [Patescibacteria group bacterium]